MRWLKLANKWAAKSKLRQKHGAVIVRNSSVLALGFNKHRVHGFYGWMEDDQCSFHAEVMAIRACKSSLKGATLYVTRLGLRNSKPCINCQTVIDKTELLRVVYT